MRVVFGDGAGIGPRGWVRVGEFQGLWTGDGFVCGCVSLRGSGLCGSSLRSR